MTGYRPSLPLRAVGAVFDLYRRSTTAGLLSRPNPVRHSGFERELIVARREVQAGDVVVLTLIAPYRRPLPRWIPGAHIDLILPSGRQRQYSLNGDPADRESYRIAVRHLPDGGGGSDEIHRTAAVGDRLWVRGPRNAFPYIDAPRYVFLAGGIGITPLLPMVADAERRRADWRLVYLGRSRDTMPFLDELAARRGGRLEILPDDECGVADIDRVLTGVPRGAAVYVCGPPPLMAAALDAPAAQDPTVSVHTERFSPPPVRHGRPFRIELRRSGHSVDVAADESALTAIGRVLPDVAYSCRQGFCGTCAVTVRAGAVDHRDRRLSPAERETTMLPCVSRAAGDTVELEL
ncbi:PDR/VanB family oxidoreductase [Nocardia spumae]|uniref:PDR/VanB family oxidoreductase n=1 Tax=Nocardia spumae TaxID=2887190 RepID=UPI001D14D01F|nr:PDR/VanB family oxidoreductase [Nocardia spumae]